MPEKWVEVDTAALAANMAAIRGRLQPDCRMFAVVKANGYGHGLEVAARAFADAGADMLAVTTMEEAVRVRAAGIRSPLLLFAPSLPEEADHLLEHDLTATVCTVEQVLAFSQAARNRGKRLRVHLKVDTGMGRVGCLWTEAALLAEACHNDPYIDFEGVYTHFATAGQPDGSLFRHQRDTFNIVLESLAAGGHRPPLAHAANSSALLNAPDIHLDAVRAGTVLYGQLPPGVKADGLNLSDTWKFCCRVLQVKDLPAGWTVGYGAEYKCKRPTRIAVLPVGYADGLAVEPASVFRGKRGLKRWVGESVLRKVRPYVIIRGKHAPFIGRVAAQMACVDVTHIPEVRVGDTAKLPARRTLVSADVPRIVASEASAVLSP